MPSERGSEFLRYLADNGFAAGERLPALQDLADQLGLSVGKLREQLEVARELSLVEVRPKTGIRTLGYSFFPGIWTSLRFALQVDPGFFEAFENLRNHVEASFFFEAVHLLRDDDRRHLQALIGRAWQKLQGEPIQIPHAEHRELHLTLFSRLENPFVRGLLEAYWEAYETVGLSLYADYTFLHEVWTYHERMVDSILEGDEAAAHRALVEHTALIHKRPTLARSRPRPDPAGRSRETERVRSGGA